MRDIEAMDEVPPAKEIYVLLQNDYRISRNIRAQWFLNNLNKVVSISPKYSQDDCKEEIEIVSVINSVDDPPAQVPDNILKTRITPETRVFFLSSRYRMVFCLDLSPSVATIDSQHGNLYLDEIYPALRQCLECVCQPFFIPGSQFFFRPEIHITIIAHVQNSPSGVPQVLIQGLVLTPDSLDSLLNKLQNAMNEVAASVAKTTSKQNEVDFLAINGSISSALLGNSQDSTKLQHMITADVSTLNLLLYGILALQLLPENSNAGIVVITDGVISFPNAQVQDSLLSQLRNSTISCSFLQMGSPYQPFSCFGRNPYTELMQFISAATCGAYFPSAINAVVDCHKHKPNIFHQSFLYWSFQTTRVPDFFKEYNPFSSNESYWTVDNPHFYSVSNQSRVQKKHTEGKLTVSFENVLSCRLREGYTIKNVIADEGKNTIEIRLLLPWNLSTNFEYVIKSNLTQYNSSLQSSSKVSNLMCSYELIVDGCYEFLHDVMCSDKNPIKSHYRAIVIKQFWSYVNSLSHTDQILIHLHSFTRDPAHYTIPESIKNGVPLCYLHSTSGTAVLSNKNMGHSSFTQFWKPLCALDINVWQKWLHTHRIGIILQHDMPLPKNLHLPNASGRYVHIQCRQAITSLNSLLRDYSSFVLVENHFYVKFLFRNAEKPPSSFFVIRVTSKAPCMVIRLAFLGGLPGCQRNEIVKDLRERICNLKLPKRKLTKDQHSNSSVHDATYDISCCFLLRKPVEKILIRYERLPDNFFSSVSESQTCSRQSAHPLTEHIASNILSKYLLHQRWVWSMQRGPNSSLALPTVSKILSVLTKIKLKQGFHFSHLGFGITYMVKEMPMKSSSSETESKSMQSPCVVQYLMFPPHTNTTFKDSTSEEEDSELPESDGELQLITECWIEPQCGITLADAACKNFSELSYQQISQAIYKEDWECISVLTTFEHLSSLCQKKDISKTVQNSSSAAGHEAEQVVAVAAEVVQSSSPFSAQSHGLCINLVPYSFNIVNLLCKCHQIELSFPTLCQSSSEHEVGDNLAVEDSTANDLLVEYFLKNVKNFQDKELILSSKECLDFLLQMHHRCCSNTGSPFPHFNTSQGSRAECQKCSKLTEALTSSDEESQNCLIPKWSCFLKACSSSHFLMTFIPSTAADLKKLVCRWRSHGVEDDVEASVQAAKLSLVLPVYTYNCTLPSIINQLIETGTNCYREDRSHLYSFKYDDSSSDSELKTESVGSACENILKHDRFDKSIHRSFNFKLDKAFSKSFVYAVYRSLVLNVPVNKSDVVAAIDDICEKILLEIDITDFVCMICGHIKDFTFKQTVKHHLAIEKAGEKNEPTANISGDSADRIQLNFPMTLLQRHQPCEQLFQKHLDIKERFCNILKCFLKKIPSRPDYYIFCPVEENDESNVEQDSPPGINQDTSHTEPAVPMEISLEKDQISTDVNPEEVSLHSLMNTQLSLSSLEEDEKSSFSHNGIDSSPPLFVNLLCSVKTKDSAKSCSILSIPTCLNDLQDCIETTCSEIDLEKFCITLDITCLMLPSDIESPSVALDRQYSLSFSSSSPVPDSTQAKSSTVKTESCCSSSESLSETIHGTGLSNIPPHQREGVDKCIDKIKWLLVDEKAAAALNTYPITSETLNMVATHVKNAKNETCCIVKEVPLKFVFELESNVEKFTQVFKRLTLPGYHLNEEGDFYYLVLNADNVDRQNQSFSSLKPPLGIASEYLLVHHNLHCDDSTQLKKLCDEETRSLKSSGHLNTPVFNVLRGSRNFRLVCHEDDTETEDGNDHRGAMKMRISKKSIGKNSQEKSDLVQRLYSEPSLMPLGSLTKRSYSLPMNLHLLSCDVPSDEKTSSSHSADVSFDSDWKSGKSRNFGQHSPQCSPDWQQEYSTTVHAWDFPPSRNAAPSVSSVLSTAKSKATDSPQFFSDIDYASIFGSRHFSNTEDGYDGDSSDTNSEWDWLSALDTKYPVLPNFWLILMVHQSKVTIYFHIRHRKDEDDELKQSHEVLSQTVTVIANICKEVNQTILLQTLHKTRMCDPQLVPEENANIWKKSEVDVLSKAVEALVSQEDSAEASDKSLEANFPFIPGTFSCLAVWTTHFRLHHRLTTGHSGHKSKGIQAFRTVLDTFSVNNRDNMFVYQERSGSVFYLRLYETICDVDHNTSKSKMEGSLSPNAISSIMLQSRKFCRENENEGEFRSRVNSGHSDTGRDDSISNLSSVKYSPRCIELHVHGIGEVGNEIKVDLVQVLQNRLNDSVLDMIIIMLSRNPLCKLTPEDVQFIQNPTQPPSSQLHFTIPVKLLCYAHSIHMYLRQNMLHFLYNPKYADNRKENHFKAFSENTSEWAQVDDNDIFLYHSQQASGYSGSKGIACVILSLVTGQGHPFEHLSNSLPNPSAYQDGLSENDFQELTFTQHHILKKSKTPGPVALIRFQIWNVGKDSTEHIESHLHDAVRHALWDLLMEYKILTVPVTDTVIEDVSCCSEPTTPIRIRRTGRSAVDHSMKMKEFSPIGLYNSKEISSSVPDIAAKLQSPSLPVAGVFQFKAGPQSAKPDISPDPSQSRNGSGTSNSLAVHDGSRCNLNYIFHSIMKSFLQFGSQLGCPALSEHIFHLPSRHCISMILTEIQNIVKATDRELNMRIFIRVTNAMTADTEFVPFYVTADSNDSDEQKSGTERNFILVGRNYKQWNAYLGTADFIQFHESYTDALKSYQRFQTHMCNLGSPEKLQDSMPASPTSVGQSQFFTAVSSPLNKSPGVSSLESPLTPRTSTPVFVPRQRLLLMFLQDRKLSVFLYNWSQDVTSTFLKKLTKLIEWHESRNFLLNNLIVQKLGLFHGQTFPDHWDKGEKSDKNELNRKLSISSCTISWKTAEQLFQHSSAPREQASTSSTSTRQSALKSDLPNVLDVLKNTRPPVPLHCSKHCTIRDPVRMHGMQVQDICSAQKRGRDMQELRAMWEARDTSFHNPYVDRLLLLLKRACRLSHYCLTPILFSPSWRWKVAPIRDHTVQPMEPSATLDKSPSDSVVSVNRSRHSSGSSLKNTEGASLSTTNTSRSRRASGAAVLTSMQCSPKIRMKNPSEETWHQTVCNHYLMEYTQYLQTLGFVPLQTKEIPHGPGRNAGSSDGKYGKAGVGSLLRTNLWGPFHLIRYQQGGLLLFEIGLCNPYAYGHLYSIDRARLNSDSIRALSSQFTSAFLDEVDKVKSMMHLHSFTYDYHLRTIHSYISGRQLIFKHGYHLTSFLDDFMKYYQKSPNGAQNLLYADTITIMDINMHGHQLYNYIISHNQLYGMTVLRMVPIIHESSMTEFVLVELSAHKAPYKDSNDVFQMGKFDIGLLINHNIENLNANRNTLVLNYYIILTSQRELFPKLEHFGIALGSFQTVRFPPSQTSSAFSSRKTSTVSLLTEKDKLESSGEETSSSSNDSRSRKAPSALGITDEEVTYLGYFSSQETTMQKVLLQEAEVAQKHLTGVFYRAAIHCRRDFLWSAFLPRSFNEKDNVSKDSYLTNISYVDFSELLNLVSPMPLDDIDSSLAPFLDMNISWYKSLISVLKVKYADLYREFSSPDQPIQYIAVTHIRCPDAFMLLSIDVAQKRAELNLVLREPLSGFESGSDKPSQRVLALQSLLEEFVNVCCFQLWSSILT